MNWINIWTNVFGSTELLGLDMGFWVSMVAVAVIVIIQHVIFWGLMKARKR